MEAEPQSPRAAGFACLPHDVAAAVFARLSPRTLAVAACASRAWRRLAAEQPWQEHYAALWGEHDDVAAAEAADAQRRYGARQQLARCWLGRPMLDKLGGHSSAVKACCLLPRRGLLFSGGVDRLVRCWDLRAGIQLGARCAARRWRAGRALWPPSCFGRRDASNRSRLLLQMPHTTPLPPQPAPRRHRALPGRRRRAAGQRQQRPRHTRVAARAWQQQRRRQ